MRRVILLLPLILLTTPTFLSFFGDIKENEVVIFFNKWDAKPFACKFKEETGFKCASCGLTKGWISIAKGNLIKASIYNKNSIKTFFVWNLIVLLIFISTITGQMSRRKFFLIFGICMIMFGIGWHEIVEENFDLYRAHGFL